MQPSTRTPEGDPLRCQICGALNSVLTSMPPGDSVCPVCGSHAWMLNRRQDPAASSDGINHPRSLLGAYSAENVPTSHLSNQFAPGQFAPGEFAPGEFAPGASITGFPKAFVPPGDRRIVLTDLKSIAAAVAITWAVFFAFSVVIPFAAEMPFLERAFGSAVMAAWIAPFAILLRILGDFLKGRRRRVRMH